MDITSINELKFDFNQDLYNLFNPSFLSRTDVELFDYIVTDDEMRIDLIFKNIYNLEYDLLDLYLKDLDIILFINGIDNPISIKKGTLIRYPDLSSLDLFRYNPSKENIGNDTIRKLSVENMPNKSTRVDSKRTEFIESNYSLSPVIAANQIAPVRIENGNFKIGGINN